MSCLCCWMSPYFFHPSSHDIIPRLYSFVRGSSDVTLRVCQSHSRCGHISRGHLFSMNALPAIEEVKQGTVCNYVILLPCVKISAEWLHCQDSEIHLTGDVFIKFESSTISRRGGRLWNSNGMVFFSLWDDVLVSCELKAASCSHRRFSE